ncbi:uncharacterized protein AC631_04765 [Debaryomyces fabryi]|uniref:Uncharacterized protein n=1 Tax=Debaryomyces fabryi TaxID=58627 RepID=A0A0V1PTB0_9ASCO|nr:uncharacterized protein AC631_04765 [Debaryomyces fabryi]KRZ99479.1 hypothetical protein AC631_04765 [Debaryomyces fabryi]CUM50863.1 unnamed protein product [Debaryomyces fabryi]
MEGNNSNSPFYNHGNNSTSSTLQFTPGTNTTSQISSVGFNNLKKVGTNSSQVSTSSTATNRNNPITRLFTKNRSNSTVNPQLIQFDDGMNELNNSDEDDTSTASTTDPRKPSGSGMFKFSKKNKLKFSSKTNSSKPDLTIQTGGHHALKVPKKILSSSLLDDASSPTGHALKVPKKILNPSHMDESPNSNSKRKNSVTSPASTFHNFFHRAHNNSQPSKDLQHIISKDDLISLQQTINNNPNRTAMSLSSNNSNSFITDINFALVYNFTDPDYSVEEYENSNEHTSFLDIHKKLMVPTDQYLLNKLHKHQAQEVGLGIISDTDGDSEYLNKYLLDFGKNNVTFFNNLISIMKPLFQPSQQKRLNNKIIHPYLGMTLEDISNYIKDNYLAESSNTPSAESHFLERTPGSKLSKSRSKTKFYTSSSTSTLSLGENSNDIFDDFKIREISQDLLTFFIKCMITFDKDFAIFENKIKTKNSVQKANTGLPSHSVEHNNEWNRISEQWTYFNERIRYYVMGIFHPLQKHLHDIAIQKFNSDPKSVVEVEIENILLLAFRDVIVIPFLIRRNQEYHRLSSMGQKITPEANDFGSPSPMPSYTFLLETVDGTEEILKSQEEDALKSNATLLKSLVNCFGVLVAHTHGEIGNSDGEQHTRNNIFSDTFIWLTNLA